MARLTRYTQSVFGSSAGSNQMAKYGSFAAGSPMTFSGATITPTIVQALSAYLTGWFTAVEGAFSPAIEDMNSLCFLFGYQLSYVLQAGLPEWDSGTTYYTGDLAQDGTGVIYASLTNTNLNNALTDGTHWFAFPQAGTLTNNSLPYTTATTLPANQSLMWPKLSIVSGQSLSVPNNASLIGVTSITVSGTGSLTASGSGTIRVI